MFMITFTIREVAAVCQYILAEKKRGRGYWDTLWKGGEPEDAEKDPRSTDWLGSKGEVFAAMGRGVNVPINLVLTAAIGIWLMASPQILHITALGADSDYISGALIVVLSFICMAEVIRPGRLLIGLIGVWLIVAIWVLPVPEISHRQWSNLVAGILLILLSLGKGKIKEKYGSIDRYLI